MVLTALRIGGGGAAAAAAATNKLFGLSQLQSQSQLRLRLRSHGSLCTRNVPTPSFHGSASKNLAPKRTTIGARLASKSSNSNSNSSHRKSMVTTAAESRTRSVRARKRSKPSSNSSSSCSSSKHPQQQQRQKATLAKASSSSSSSSRSFYSAWFLRWFPPRYHNYNYNYYKRKWTQTNIHRWLNEPRRLSLPRWISPRMITIRYSECFGHGSFLLVAVSYAMDDFLQLRMVAIAGSTAMLVFAYFHPHGRVLWLPFRWNCVFVALNSWRVAGVLLDRYRSGCLGPDLDRMYDHHFAVLEKAGFAKLVRLGTLETYEEGDPVLEQGQDNRWVRLVVSGDLAVDRDGQVTYFLHEGQFVSEVGLHAGLGLRGSVASCCGVTAASRTVTLLAWDRTELMHLLELHKHIERALRAVLSWDIVSKLKSQRALLASGHVHDAERWTNKRREQSIARYRAILRNMLDHPRYLNADKERLAKYREIHRVSDEDHRSALSEIGWTVSEFESGTKEGQLDEDVLERERLGFGWWVRSWWNAL